MAPQHRVSHAAPMTLPPPRGRRVVSIHSPEQRAQHVQDEIRERIADGDVDACMAAMREAMTATMFVRGPKENGQNTYIEVSDHASRLAAVKLLLAYRYGQPPSHQDVVVHRPPSEPRSPIDPREVMRELIETGVDLENILRVWVRP